MIYFGKSWVRKWRYNMPNNITTITNYSETSCSFARHFATLSRNVGVLIGSVLRASLDSNFNLLPEQTVHTGILWVDCDGKQHYTSVSKREKVISLWSSGYRNQEISWRLHLSYQTISNILSKFSQNGTAAPEKTRMERTHSRYSKCGGICGVLQGF